MKGPSLSEFFHRPSSSSSPFFLSLFLVFLIVLNVGGKIHHTVTITGDDDKLERQPAIQPAGDGEARRLAEQLYTGQKNPVRGVYVAGKFALPVIQQPQGKSLFVSNQLGLVTQFQMAAKNGIIGLLAHDFLSGKEFTALEMGELVWIIYGNKEIEPFQITSIQEYQKLDPDNVYSDYRELDSQTLLTTAQLFNRYYRGGNHITLQTCLEREGRQDWGLLFVVATRPASH